MKKLITISLLAALGIGLFMFLSGSVGFRDTGVAKQNDIQAAYNQNRSHLASYARQIETEVGLAKLNLSGLDKFMQDAVSGRYQTGNTADANKTGTLFSAMHEAYPTLPPSMYPEIMKAVESAGIEVQERPGRPVRTHRLLRHLDADHVPRDVQSSPLVPVPERSPDRPRSGWHDAARTEGPRPDALARYLQGV